MVFIGDVAVLSEGGCNVAIVVPEDSLPRPRCDYRGCLRRRSCSTVIDAREGLWSVSVYDDPVSGCESTEMGSLSGYDRRRWDGDDKPRPRPRDVIFGASDDAR